MYRQRQIASGYVTDWPSLSQAVDAGMARDALE